MFSHLPLFPSFFSSAGDFCPPSKSVLSLSDSYILGACGQDRDKWFFSFPFPTKNGIFALRSLLGARIECSSPCPFFFPLRPLPKSRLPTLPPSFDFDGSTRGNSTESTLPFLFFFPLSSSDVNDSNLTSPFPMSRKNRRAKPPFSPFLLHIGLKVAVRQCISLFIAMVGSRSPLSASSPPPLFS